MLIVGWPLKHKSWSMAGGGNATTEFATVRVIRMALETGAPVTRSVCRSICQLPAVTVFVPETNGSCAAQAPSASTMIADQRTRAPPRPTPKISLLPQGCIFHYLHAIVHPSNL